MKPLKLVLLISAVLSPISPVFADDLSDLKSEIAQIRSDYEQRIQQLEQRLAKAESTNDDVQKDIAYVKETARPTASPQNKNSFNPAISMVLNGQFNNYSNNVDNYSLNGFSLQQEAGLATEGMSLGESELTLSASVDQLLSAQATFALADEDGTTSVGIEEAFIQTLGLGHGLTMRAGRFYSPIGYLNERHVHAWNFSDAPLIYRGLFGDQLATDGLKLSYLLPTDQMIELGGTIGNGDSYPGSGTNSGIGDWLVYAKTGGDIGISHSWQAGLSHWQSSPEGRNYGNGASEVTFTGDTDITNVSLIYKWAPNGNATQQNFTLLGEYFYQNDDGSLNNTVTSASYDGKQYGGYVEGIYQFIPHWRTGLRYDRLGSSLTSADNSLFTDAEMNLTGNDPQRYSLMLEWLPSEFSRVRAQINRDQSSNDDDTQFFLQYTVNLGAHGAHSY